LTEIEQGIAVTSMPEPSNPMPESPFNRKMVAGLAALALAAGIAVEQPESAVAAGHRPSAEWALVQPDNLTVLKQEKACTPRHQVKLSLYKNRVPNNGMDAFLVQAKNCKKAGHTTLKNVILKNDSAESKHEAWKIKSLRPGKTKSFTFTLPALRRTVSDVAPGSDKQDVSLQAFTPKRGQLGHNVWTLRNSVNSTDDLTQPPHIPDPEVVKQALENCTPSPDFKVGIQDDPQSVFERDINRNQLFDLGRQIFNASYVRINVIYGLVQQVGLQPYIDAVNAAKANGYKVDMTLMPTPSYMPDADQTLGYKNWDPQTMQSFAQTIGATFGSSVEDYSIGNEVNHWYFNADESMPRFKAAYLAGRAGLLAAYPQAKILIGELAPVDVSDWINYLNKLPNDGIAIHPYGDTINHLPTYISEAKTPLYLTEYGNFRSPTQMANNKAAEILARCTGTERLTMYQVIHNTDKVSPTTAWDTGVIDAPPR
jgi:hypothetical protein